MRETILNELDLNETSEFGVQLDSADAWMELVDIDGGNDSDQVVGSGELVQPKGSRKAVKLLDTLALNTSVLKGDVDDGSVNNLDITPFIGLLAAAGSNGTAVPEPTSLVCVVLALMIVPRRAVRR